MEVALARYTINGNFDEISAKLKKSFEAEESKFNASLNKMFKPAAPEAPEASAAGIHPPAGPAPDPSCRLASRQNGDHSLRGRMRSTLRSSR